MSISALNWAFQQDLKSTQKFVLVALADCADDYGICWPSVRKISLKTSLSRRAVQGALSELEAKNFLERVVRSRAGGINTTNAYKIPVFEGIIDDHPCAIFFKSYGAQETHPTGAGDAPTGAGDAPTGAGDAPLEAPINHHLTLKEKKPASRDEFLRGVNKRFHKGDYERFKGSESWINTNAHDAWLHWEGHGFPRGDYYSAFFGWMRNAKAEHDLNKHIKKNTERTTATHDPNSQWRARVGNYVKGLAWMSQWGPAPDEKATKVPAEILNEFSINQPQEKYDA